MIELRPYQAEGLAAVWDYFSSGKTGNPLLAWPTGTGKSVCPAVFITYVLKQWPNQRFLMITHIKELIEQNAEVLKYVWPEAPLGIYSAGLGYKQFQLPVVYGGIQSMIKNPALFGHRDIIFIDEAHLVNQDEASQYLTFIATMKLINPQIKVIGMTATPFRMGQGYITDEGLFTDIVHDLTSMDNFNKLITDGYMCPLIPRRTTMELDVSNVGMSKGEFIQGQLQNAVDKREITYAGLKEVVAAGQNRKSWLIFASGIEHAEHIADMLNSFNVDCAAVHSKRNSDFNTSAIRAFKNNSLRSIVNFSKLTTGFNHPDIDLIADFRPTLSIPLHVQKLGRGTRPANGKENCLVLDFGRNVPRLGPINDPIIPRKKGEKTDGEAPIKICDACGTYNHAAARLCVGCGNEFQFKIKITKSSSTDEIIKSDFPVIEWFNVDRAIYVKKQGKIAPYIKASYFCGMHLFIENVFPENHRYKKPFHDWWKQRHTTEPPLTTQDALKYISELRIPKRIRVWVNKRYPDVQGVEF
jgi:DNA repair protein RadD